MRSFITPQTNAKKAARRIIGREIRTRYKNQMKSAGVFRRLIIWFKIQKEIEAELNRRFPPQALYVRYSGP